MITRTRMLSDTSMISTTSFASWWMPEPTVNHLCVCVRSCVRAPTMHRRADTPRGEPSAAPADPQQSPKRDSRRRCVSTPCKHLPLRCTDGKGTAAKDSERRDSQGAKCVRLGVDRERRLLLDDHTSPVERWQPSRHAVAVPEVCEPCIVHANE